MGIESKQASTPGDDLVVNVIICLLRHMRRASAILNKKGAPEIPVSDDFGTYITITLTFKQEDVPDSRAVLRRNNANKSRQYPNAQLSTCV